MDLNDAKIPEVTSGPTTALALRSADREVPKFYPDYSMKLRRVVRWVRPYEPVKDSERKKYVVFVLGPGQGAYLLGDLVEDTVPDKDDPLIQQGKHSVYLMDPRTGTVERRPFGVDGRLGAVEAPNG